MATNNLKPHKHADIIRAYAQGHTIQFKHFPSDKWQDVLFPSFFDSCDYRIKPQDDVVKYAAVKQCLGEITWVSLACNTVQEVYTGQDDRQVIKLTFDADTKKLKKVELYDQN